MLWRDAVLSSLHSYSTRHFTRSVNRQRFIAEELHTITNATESRGLTPDQTLSRVLQELRDDGLIEFLKAGDYLLLDTPIDVESEDLADDAIDSALWAGKLKLGKIETDNQICLARRRKGQDRLRRLVTKSYRSQCATCDITDSNLLIASHIVAWAEAPEHRGDLANVICLCRIHDALFERGYWSLSDDLRLVKTAFPNSDLVCLILNHMTSFCPPVDFPPGSHFLREHRLRSGFTE